MQQLKNKQIKCLHIFSLTNQDGRQTSFKKNIFLLLQRNLQHDLKCYWRQTDPCVKYAKYLLLQLLQMPLQSDLKCCWMQKGHLCEMCYLFTVATVVEAPAVGPKVLLNTKGTPVWNLLLLHCCNCCWGPCSQTSSVAEDKYTAGHMSAATAKTHMWTPVLHTRPEKKLHKLREVQLLKIFSATFVKLSAKFGSLNLPIRNNFKQGWDDTA